MFLTPWSLFFAAGLIFIGIWLGMFVYFKRSYTYWKKKGVPYLEPSFPYGNYMYAFSRAPTFAGETKVWYNELKAKGHKFGGVWMFARPILILVDPDYIKDILTKDFHHFIDRDIFVNAEGDPRGTHLFNISSTGWKELRQKLTPTFTSGKMKMMFNSVLNCSNPMITFLEEQAKLGDDINIREGTLEKMYRQVEVRSSDRQLQRIVWRYRPQDDIKHYILNTVTYGTASTSFLVMASFTTDVIFSVAFGVNYNSFTDTESEFRKQREEIFRFGLSFIPQILMMRSFPSLSKKIGLKLGKDTSKNFFAGVVKQAIDYRSENNVKIPDFLQLLIDINENTQSEEKPFSFDEIVANTFLFFLAGFDTSSSAMNFVLYELARNKLVQEKTRNEINRVLKKYNGITYEAIKEMTYLNQVLDETMRIWPPLISLGRICTKDYKLRDTNIVIEKGTAVGISTLGLGRDPEYFPDPEKFDPDRFNVENKAKRHPYIHIPFGEGPRNCIGLRFGAMQSKIGLIRILTNFRLSVSSKTKMPLTVEPTRFLLKSKEKLLLKIEKIE